MVLLVYFLSNNMCTHKNILHTHTHAHIPRRKSAKIHTKLLTMLVIRGGKGCNRVGRTSEFDIVIKGNSSVVRNI